MSKKTHRKKKDHAAPSQVLLAARLASGAGKHTISKARSNERNGRLKGAEKANIRKEYGLHAGEF